MTLVKNQRLVCGAGNSAHPWEQHFAATLLAKPAFHRTFSGGYVLLQFCKTRQHHLHKLHVEFLVWRLGFRVR